MSIQANNRKKNHGFLGLIALVGCLLSAPGANAFTELNLTQAPPDILANFISVNYVGDSASGVLTANGFADSIDLGGGITENITGGTFDILANVMESANGGAGAANGTLDIGGTIANLGFNSGTLLTGTLTALGAGATDPLEFLFDVTGGDAASLFGSTAGVILAFSGYAGSFAGPFSSAPFGSVADTFGVNVSEPASIALMLGAGLLLVGRRRRRRTAPGATTTA